MSRTIAVTGATGFVGSHLVDAFAAAGWNVLALCRRPEQQPARAHVSYAPFELERAGETHLAGVDLLIHCALVPYRDTNGAASNLNIAGSRALFQSARAQGTGKIAFISSTASRAHTPSEYGKEKFEVEQLLDRRRDLIIRPGLVIGDGGLARSMYDSIRKFRVAPLFFGGRKPVYTVAVSDLAAAVLGLASRDASGVYVLTAQPVPMRTLYERLASKAKVHAFFVPLPYAPALQIIQMLERLHVPLPMTSGSMKGVASMEYLDLNAYPHIEGIRSFHEVMENTEFSGR